MMHYFPNMFQSLVSARSGTDEIFRPFSVLASPDQIEYVHWLICCRGYLSEVNVL